MAGMFLVALEGVDGSGKSTVSPLVEEELVRRGIDCRRVGEFGSEVGELLFKLLNQGLSPYQKTLFFALDRSLMLDAVRAEIDYGQSHSTVVLWDRYALSAHVCRQMEIEDGTARPELEETVVAVNDSFPPADLVVYFDVPVGVCADRVVERGYPAGGYDDQVERLSTMRSMYLDRLPPDHASVDGQARPEDCAISVADSIERRWRA